MINAQLTSVAPTRMARQVGRVPLNQASSGQLSTAPATPPASNATVVNQRSVGTFTQLGCGNDSRIYQPYYTFWSHSRA